eukprot:10807-Rhodomonas_salina.1
MSVGIQVSTLSRGFSFHSPEISSIFVVNYVSDGVERVTIIGSNFGSCPYTARPRLGGTSIQTTQWISDTAIQGYPSAGFGGTLQVVVTSIYTEDATLSQAFSHDGQQLSGLSIVNGPTLGAIFTQLTGLNLGS